MAKISIKVRYIIQDFNIVIDENGNFWRLPFIDKRGRTWGPKRLVPVIHSNLPCYRINNRYISERVLNSKRKKKEYLIEY